MDSPPPTMQGWRPRMIAEKLKPVAGHWQEVETGRTSTAFVQNWTRLGCQATSRKQADGTYTVWAMWPADEAEGGR